MMKLPFTIDLKGKVVVITGGAATLCVEFARAMANCGAHIALLDLNGPAAEQYAAEIRAAGGSAIGICANVLDKTTLEAAAHEVNTVFGPCDLLINGAGGNRPKGTTGKSFYEAGDRENPDVLSFFDLDPSDIRFVFDLNFLGTLLPTQVFAQQMLSRSGCSIINISSMNAFRPLTRIPAYSAAKAAVSNFTQWLAVHLSRQGIRVNALAPGFFHTAQNHQLLVDATTGQNTPRARQILDHTPMGRFGSASDLVGSLLWLACNEASGFVNGVVVPVDGGFAAYSGV